MALGGPEQDINTVNPEDTLNGLKTIPPNSSGYMDILNKYLPPLQGTIPPVQGPTPQSPIGGEAQLNPVQVAQSHQIGPDAQPLVDAVDHGVADKKFMGPIDIIRKGIQSGDEETIHKGHMALSRVIAGPESFGEWWNETMAGHPGKVAAARRIAGDVVMREIANATGAGMSTVAEAVQLGLLQPNQLIPGSQVQAQFAHLIPQEPFAFSPEGEPVTSTKFFPTPAQPDQKPAGYDLIPGARLTTLQQQVAESNQKGIEHGIAYKAALAADRGDYLTQRALTEKYKREVEAPAKLSSMATLDALREAQIRLAGARENYIDKLPQLRREMSSLPPFQLEAIKRVHTAIQQKQPIDKADWLIIQPFLRKGFPEFGVNFLGKVYSKLTGKVEGQGDSLDWLGIPEPPSTLSEDQRGDVKQLEDDTMHQIGAFIGSLIRGAVGAKEETKPETKPSPLTSDEKAELDRLRKKHGK